MLVDEEDLRRFWSMVQKSDGCWVWTGRRNRKGYGVFHPRGANASLHVHAIALALATGGRPGMAFACHHCDNRPCVNPAHLYWGDAATNRDDARKRGRLPRGENHPNSKLTDLQRQEIRDLRARGVPILELMQRYNVSRSTIKITARSAPDKAIWVRR